MKHYRTSNHWITCAVAALSALLTVGVTKADTQLENFDNLFLWDAQYASWSFIFPPPGTNNWTLTNTTDFGGAVATFKDTDFVDMVMDASGDDTVELALTILGTNSVGPQLLLEDGDGTRVRYSWFGTPPGSHVLTQPLDSSNWDGGTATGSIAGLQLTNLVLFHVQVDDGAGANAYGMTLENLRTFKGPAPPCDELVSDFDNVGLLGGYGSWSTLPPPTPDDWTFTRTDFGGGFQNISPSIDASMETTLELQLSITNTSASIGALVVLQDGDGTQERWSWFGLTNGSYVLTDALSAGTPVASQPGTIPGFDSSSVQWFHLQVDDGTNSIPYTVSFENLRFFGFNPEITDFSFDPATGLADLTWDSRVDRAYNVWQVSELTDAFTLVASNIVAVGESTATTVASPSADQGYFLISEDCQ